MSKQNFRPIKPLPLFLDNPVETDTLGLIDLAHTIAGVAIGNPGPMTVGIFGGWGQGKTSVLRVAQKLLSDSNSDDVKVATVWFNAWQHEREDHPLFPLIAAVVEGLERLSIQENKLELKEKWSKVSISLRALSRGMKFSGKVGIPLVGEVGVEFDSEKALLAEELLGKQSHPLLSELLYHQAFTSLERVMNEYHEKEKSTSQHHSNIVVFIDDLDRCNPERALHLLEGIKLILSQPGFIFVMAVDRSVIEDYLEYLYESTYHSKDATRGRRYLDKMVQLALPLPNSSGAFQAHINKLLEDFANRGGDSKRKEIIESVSTALIEGAKGNPRNLVRNLNRFLVQCELWHEPNRIQEVAPSLLFHQLLEAEVEPTWLEYIASDEEFWMFVIGQSFENYLTKSPDALRNLDNDQLIKEQCWSIIHRSKNLTDMIKGQALRYAKEPELRASILELSSRYRVQDRVILPEVLARLLQREIGKGVDEPIVFGDLSQVYVLDFTSVKEFSDEWLFLLQPCRNLEALYLGRTKITDSGVRALLAFKELDSISLIHTEITDDALETLSEVKKLRFLSLDSTNVTDQGLKSLSKLAELETLSVADTKITNNGVYSIGKMKSLKHVTAIRTHVKGIDVNKINKSLKVDY